MTDAWLKAITTAELEQRGHAVVRAAGKQIALFSTPEGIFACNNRCPHEGYPLSEGTLDEGCQLTCNWHNWKFDLRTGDNLYGGDRLRVYPTQRRNGAIWIDMTEPPFEERRDAIMRNLREAVDDNDYTRMAREVARLVRAGGDAIAAVAAAVAWSHERLEFGMTHAYAGGTDWLALHDRYGDDRHGHDRHGHDRRGHGRHGDGHEFALICLVETIGHIADDVLRQPDFPYGGEAWALDEDDFVAAVEAEDEAAAIAMTRGALADGGGFAGMERGLTRAALQHYNDFGHSLIYTVKAGQLIDRLGPDSALPVLLALVRSLVFANRDDLVPEFRHYGPALAAWGDGAATPPAADAYRGQNVRHALALTVGHSGAPAEAIYDALLAANAANLLTYNTGYQERFDGPVADNVGWLSFTHGITFANAVRRQCTKFPALWPAGLLQMACFSGRNAPYTDAATDAGAWRVDDAVAFFAGAYERLFDHGRDEFIESVHIVKTLMAAEAELAAASAATAAAMLAGVNRFLNSPLKRRHVRRAARQALAFVARDD